MATSKTLTPTNVTIQIPEFTDQPDQRVNSNCIDKEADAINTLNTNMANKVDKGEVYLSEVEVGLYNGTKLYRKIFTSQAKTVANNTTTNMMGGMPALNKIICCTFTCYNRTNGVIESPDAYHRVYIHSDGSCYFNQTVSSSACEYIVRADVYYTH